MMAAASAAAAAAAAAHFTLAKVLFCFGINAATKNKGLDLVFRY